MAKIDELKADTVEAVEEVRPRRGRPRKTAEDENANAAVNEEAAKETEPAAEQPAQEEEVQSAEEKETEEEAKASEPSKAPTELKADSADEAAPVAVQASEGARRGRRRLEDMTASEQIRLHVQRNTYAVEKADKETRREIYSGEHVFVAEGDEKYLETEATKKNEEWNEIVSSAGVDRVLTGTIVQVTEVDSEDKDDPDHVPEYMARVKYKSGNWPINIPSYVLYDYEYTNYTREVADSIRRNITRRIGSEVQFVVRYANEKTGVVYGDRLSALSMSGVEHYASIRGRRPDITVGMQALAQIIAVASNYILVEAYGAEIRIPLEEISWLYVSDARIFDGINTEECYKVGKRIPVKILSVDFKKIRKGNSSYTLVVAEGSIKQTKTNPKIKYYDNYKVNDICAGIVTGRLDESVFLNINNEMDCKCLVPNDNRIRIPVMGDHVVVRISEKDDELRRLKGRILAVN